MGMTAPEITGHLVIIMAPMASGKGTLVSHVRSVFPQITHTVSCTTRPRRPGEVDGTHYYFIDRAEFEKRIDAGAFMEWAEFGGNLYGTLKSELLDRLVRGELVICEIEIQGVLQLLNIVPREYRTLVYIDGGSWDALKARACARAPIGEDELQLRYTHYLTECEYQSKADVVIDNQDGKLEEAKAHIVDVFKNIISTMHTT